MKNIYLYNANISKTIETKYYTLQPVEDFKELYKQWEKRNKISRNENFKSTLVKEKVSQTDIPKSSFYSTQPKIWDYCAILSLFQNRNIFPFQNDKEGSPLFARMGHSYDWTILNSKEICTHLEPAVQKLDSFSEREQYVFLRSLMLLFEGDFFTHYGDFKDIWYLQPLELFCRGIYCIDKDIADPKSLRHIKFFEYLKYCVKRFEYDAQYEQPESINQFLKDIVSVRDWVMHGKVWECSVFSGQAGEVTFHLRIQALLKAFLLSYLDINSFTNRDALIHGIILGNHIIPIWDNS